MAGRSPAPDPNVELIRQRLQYHPGYGAHLARPKTTRSHRTIPLLEAVVQALKSHQAYWDAARRARGDAAGTRALIEIMLSHRTMPDAALIAAMDRAVASGCLDPQVVVINSRCDTTAVAPVVPIGTLARYDRAAPSLSGYDDLLTGSGT